MRDPLAEALLDSDRVKYVYIPAVPLKDIDKQTSCENHARFQPLTQSTVDRYVILLEQGSEAPAVIGYRGLRGIVLGDGNHRFQAASDAGRETIDCYLFEVDDVQTRDGLIRSFNARLNGLGQPDTERLSSAQAHLSDYPNVPVKEVARLFLFKEDTLQRKLREAKTKARLVKFAFKDKEIATISSGMLERMWGIVSDPTLQATAKLITDADLRGTVAADFITDVKRARSESASAEVIAQWQDKIEINEALRQNKNGRVHIPKTNRQRLFEHLNGVIRLLEHANTTNDLELTTKADVEQLSKRSQLLLNLVRKVLGGKKLSV